MSATHFVDPRTAVFAGHSLHTTISSDTTTKGTEVDCEDLDYPIAALIHLGDYGDGSTQTIVKLQQSDTTTDGDFSDIADETGSSSDVPSHTFTASATANDNATVFLWSPYRSKRYVRVVAVTSGGGSVSVPISAVVLGQKKISGTGDGHKGPTS